MALVFAGAASRLTSFVDMCYDLLMDESNKDRISQLVEKAHEAMSDLGLYSINYSIGTSNPDLVSEQGEMDHDVRELIESGEASFVLNATYRLNDLAWSRRVLHPDEFDLDKQFRTMMPSADEMLVDRLKEKAAEGDFLAVFDDDEEPENEG